MARMIRRHGNHPRDIVPPNSTYFASGRFGRMFGNLPPFAADSEPVRKALFEIGMAGGIMDAKDDLSVGPLELITNPVHNLNNVNNLKMTAGMTFLGQFVDHDMTFDPTSSLERQVDPEMIANFRTPTLALDNVYGAGPGANPHLFDQKEGNGIKFLVEELGVKQKFDLPRNSQNTALIGDPRNDENLIVSQLHLAMLKFHNNVCDYVVSELGIHELDQVFAEAQRIVRWHYQWILLKEFLPLLCGEKVVDRILEEGRRFYDWRNEPFIPVEFSVAAYRFGHSQIRPSYRTNFTGATGGGQLFQFIFRHDAKQDTPENDDLSGSARADWRFIDWRTFFNFGDALVRPNKKIDPLLSTPLFGLPPTVVPNPHPVHNPTSLAQRNLLRHLTFSLPSGQRVARAMRLPVLSEGDLSQLAPHKLQDKTPLWFYILREAQVTEKGERLGPVGANIVAEVFIGLLEGDNKSFLSQEPDWKPFLPTIDVSVEGTDFTMVDLLRFAGVA